jgi:hypothetical protein
VQRRESGALTAAAQTEGSPDALTKAHREIAARFYSRALVLEMLGGLADSGSADSMARLRPGRMSMHELGVFVDESERTPKLLGCRLR